MPPLRWYKKKEFDAPELNSPQPCAHGGGCDYKRKNPETGEMVEGCCAFVHPGEEGTGRHLFDSREVERDGVMVRQPACVRLTGRAGYYERRRLRLSWKAWCEQKGIPFGRDEDEKHEEAWPQHRGGGSKSAISREVQKAINHAVANALTGGGGHPHEKAQRPAYKPRSPTPEHDAEEAGRNTTTVEDVETPASPTPTPAKTKAPRAPRKPRAVTEESKENE